MRKIKVGKTTFALILISLGILLTLRNNFEFSLLMAIKLLAGVSVIMLGLEIFWSNSKIKHTDEKIKISISGLCILAIIGLFVSAYVPNAVVIQNGEVIINDVSIFGYESNEYIFDKNIEEDFSKYDTLEVTNNFGSVRVESSENKTITIESVIAVSTSKDDKEFAEKVAEDAIKITNSGDTMKLNKHVTDSDAKVAIDYVIYVPESTNVVVKNSHDEVFIKGVKSVDVNNSFGDTFIEQIEKDVKISSSNGEIEVSSVEGELNLKNSFGSIKVTDIDGKTYIKNSNGNIEAVQVNGNLEIDGSFSEITIDETTDNVVIDSSNGEVNIKNVDGDLTIETKFSDILCSSVTGDVFIDSSNGDVTIDNVESDIDLKTKFGSVSANHISGDVDIDSSNGNIELTSESEITSDVNIETSFGDVTIYTPDSQEGRFDLNTKFGSISAPFDLSIEDDLNKESVDQTIGKSNIRITVHTSNGSIRFE